MASKKDETVIKEPFSTRFQAFLKRYKIVLWSILGLVLAVAVVLIIVFSIKASKENKLYASFTQVESEYLDIKESEDKDYSTLLPKLDNLVNASNKYPSLASLYMRANIYTEMGDFSKAFDDYSLLYDRSSNDSYFKDVALFGMASSKESLGDEKEAYDLYVKLYNDYGKASSLTPRSLFGALRYAEKNNDSDAIVIYRDALIDDYMFTDYGRYAQNLKDKETANSEQSSDSESASGDVEIGDNASV